MATMVFGRMCYEADRDNRIAMMHYALKQDGIEGDLTACGRRRVNIRMAVYSGFSLSDSERQANGQSRTTCKPCRKAMGWA